MVHPSDFYRLLFASGAAELTLVLLHSLVALLYYL